jgi:hypothetical protein
MAANFLRSERALERPHAALDVANNVRELTEIVDDEPTDNVSASTSAIDGASQRTWQRRYDKGNRHGQCRMTVAESD